MNTTHHTKTRNEQRKVKAMLNNQGIKATCKGVKTLKGWLVSVDPSTIKRAVKMACVGSNGNSVPVLIK